MRNFSTRFLAFFLLVVLSFIVLPIVTTAMMQARVINVAAGGSIQTAVNQCLTETAGCRVILQANADYVAPSEGIVLPNKSNDAYISIESSRYTEIPTRTFYSLRPTAAEAAMMPRIRSSHPAEPTIKTAPGAHHYKLLGLDLAPKDTGDSSRVLELGTGGSAQDTLEEVPHHIEVDKSWIHAGATQHIMRCVALNSAHTDITNSWLSDCHGLGIDSQAIVGWNGPGPYRIINNLLEGAGENVMFGGADPSIPGLVPSDIEIRRNYFYKPLSWKVGHPTYAGKEWVIKNLFETKNARRLVVEGNRFENNWTHGQAGAGIVIKCNNQDSTAPWSVTEDLLFQYNHVISEAGINMLLIENPPKISAIGKRIYYRHNFLQVERLPFQGPNSGEDVQIEHNTWTSSTGAVFMIYGKPTKGLKFNNNLGRRSDYGIKGDSTITGAEGTAALEGYSPGTWEMKGNVMSGAPASQYPTGNFYPATWAEVQAGSDYKLLPTSPFKGKATDGKDPGVDWAAFEAAMGGNAVTPLPSPTPTVTPTPLPSPSPVIPSPDGTKGAVITDSQLAVWTVGTSGETLRNGTHVGNGYTTSPFYKYFNREVYALAKANSRWYKWTGSIWSGPLAGEPGVITPTPTPSPSPSPTPTVQYEFRKYRWPTGTTAADEALQDAVEKQAAVEGWTDCYVTGNWLRCKRLRQ